MRKGPNTDFHPELILLNAGVLSRRHFNRIVNGCVRRKTLEYMPLTTGKFLRIIDIRIENFTKHPRLYKQPTSLSVKSLKRKMEKLHSKYVFAPFDKAANNVIIIWKRYYVEVLKSGLNSTSAYVPADLTKDKLFSGISIVSLNQISKLTKLICLHFTGCRNYTKILTNHASYLILVLFYCHHI